MIEVKGQEIIYNYNLCLPTLACCRYLVQKRADLKNVSRLDTAVIIYNTIVDTHFLWYTICYFRPAGGIRYAVLWAVDSITAITLRLFIMSANVSCNSYVNGIIIFWVDKVTLPFRGWNIPMGFWHFERPFTCELKTNSIYESTVSPLD